MRTTDKTERPQRVATRLCGTRRIVVSDPREHPLEIPFGEIALQRGYITRETLDECLAEQRQCSNSFHLGQMLIKRGDISLEQLLEILQDQKKSVETCPCSERHDPAEDDTWMGRYRLVREIARGGMAVVYEATDPDLGRKIALKILRVVPAAAETVQRLHREAALMARLSHPNIAAIHEIGHIHGPVPIYYIAMDYVKGETLEQAAVRLPLGEKLRILESVAEAVGYAHRHGVVHRDLKPSNILLDERGRPVVVDFGLACGMDDPRRVTCNGEILGTPLYISPEVLQGRGEVDPRIDVWALGVMLYEMLTGREPFDASSAFGLYQKVLKEDPPLPRRIVRGIPSDLESVCLKALEKNPEKRYPDGCELARELRRWRAGDPVRARRPGRFTAAARQLRRHLRRTLLAVATLCALLATVSGSFRMAERRMCETRRREAREAYERGDWHRSLVKCEEVIEVMPDAEMAQMADDCRSRISRRQ